MQKSLLHKLYFQKKDRLFHANTEGRILALAVLQPGMPLTGRQGDLLKNLFTELETSVSCLKRAG